MYDPQLEKLIEIALEDGVLTEKERSVLFKKARSLGIDSDEFEMVLESRLKARLGSQQPEKKQEKFGTMHKCPSCGSPVPTIATKCRECDYEFRNISANLTIKGLAEKLDSIHPDISFEAGIEHKKNIIMNHPIPNTKEDILEFGIYISSNLNCEVNSGFNTFFPTYYGKNITDFGKSRKWNDIWIAKYKQLLEKCQLYSKDDPLVKKQLLDIIRQKDVRASSNISGNIVGMVGFAFFFVGVLGMMILPYPSFIYVVCTFSFLFGFLIMLLCPIIPMLINGLIGLCGINKIKWM